MCILLVEDDFITRTTAKFTLEEAGHEVQAAEHSRHAIEHLDRDPGRFTLLLTDYHMPGEMHGGHLIEHVRGTFLFLPIILASAHPHATTSYWRQHHRVILLVKPYPGDMLIATVRSLLH